MVIVAASDQHLGSDRSDKSSFDGFLDQILADTTITDFVLLGDVVDMWRRDASGVFLENREIFDKIALIAEKIKVHYVYGNHDYHLRYLKDHSYPFEFKECLTRFKDGRKYRFVHGHRFDDLQNELLMEALCRVMSDEIGGFESEIWEILTKKGGSLYNVYPLIFEKRSVRKTVQELLRKPKDRVTVTTDDIQKKACSGVEPGEILVFGHTHVPFINKSGTVVNTGCWMMDDPIHNTYVRLDADGPRLFEFRKGEITKRVKC